MSCMVPLTRSTTRTRRHEGMDCSNWTTIDRDAKVVLKKQSTTCRDASNSGMIKCLSLRTTVSTTRDGTVAVLIQYVYSCDVCIALQIWRLNGARIWRWRRKPLPKRVWTVHAYLLAGAAEAAMLSARFGDQYFCRDIHKIAKVTDDIGSSPNIQHRYQAAIAELMNKLAKAPKNQYKIVQSLMQALKAAVRMFYPRLHTSLTKCDCSGESKSQTQQYGQLSMRKGQLKTRHHRCNINVSHVRSHLVAVQTQQEQFRVYSNGIERQEVPRRLQLFVKLSLYQASNIVANQH